MSKRIEKIIRRWVGKRYGEAEEGAPSWNIHLLSKEIAEKLKQKKMKGE